MNGNIEVTPNVMRCLEILREAIDELPEGDLKTQAEGALEYMENAARGEPQPNEGRFCQVEKPVVPSGG